MIISKLIEALEVSKIINGDVECLIEVEMDGCVVLMPVDELNAEDREGYGYSISLLM